MCGIAGYVTYAKSAVSDHTILARMGEVLVHRGPDAAGTYVSEDGRVGLASQRLAIIDLSPEADQPMADSTGRYRIVYNGEIYNFVELRRELEIEGYRFRTRSDTEVLLVLYAKYGKGMLASLRGMFAFAIWDGSRRELFLARDRLGVKPLFYAQKNGRFLFASEIKAILEWTDVDRQVDEVALSNYLSFLAVPAPRTLFRGVAKLPAAHYLVVDRNGLIRISRYWDLAQAASRIPPATGRQIEAIQALIEESAGLRMVSDVPVSILLSGGTDSSTIVRLLSRDSTRPLRTFCVGVRGSEEHNEFRFARRVAELSRAEHTELTVDLDQIGHVLPRLAYYLDDPVADATSVLTFLIFEKIKAANFKVTLTGEGSDELFAGYPYWMQVLKVGRVLPLMRLLPRSFEGPVRRLQALSPHMRWEILRRAVARQELFWSGSDGFSDGQKSYFFSPWLAQQLAGHHSGEVIAEFAQHWKGLGVQPDPLQWMTYSEVNLRLPEMLLARLDRMSMAFSVEAREPFLDHRLYEFVFGFPWRDKVGAYEPKHLFKKVIAGVVPPEVLQRPKVGFNQPLLRWMTQERIVQWQAKVLEFARRTPYFDPARLATTLSKFHPIYTWYLLMFVLWHDTWIEGGRDTCLDGEPLLARAVGSPSVGRREL